MADIPQFKLYGEDDSTFDDRIQPRLTMRSWSTLFAEEKETIFQDLINSHWIHKSSEGVLYSVLQLNHRFNRRLPAKNIHSVTIVKSPINGRIQNLDFVMEEALKDFRHIFFNEQSEELVILILSLFAFSEINQDELEYAQRTQDREERENLVEYAFQKFDSFAKQLNYLFDQFCINLVITRSGIIPRQDDRITKEIYEPTLKALSDPKWRAVNLDLERMFSNFHAQNYPEVITDAHSATQRFLQIAVGKESKNSKGEFGRLFRKAKECGIVSNNSAIEPLVIGIGKFLPSVRAKMSTSKPASQTAKSSDALLVMNTVLVIIQHCLQNRN